MSRVSSSDFNIKFSHQTMSVTLGYFDFLPLEVTNLIILHKIDIPTRVVLFHTSKTLATMVGGIHTVLKRRRKYCEITAAKGYLNVLMWMSKVGPPSNRLYPMNNRSCLKAAANGDLEMLIWMFNNSDTIIRSERLPFCCGGPWEERTIERKICRPRSSIYEAAKGYGRITNWLREYESRSCDDSDDPVYRAARENQLEVVTTLVTDGYCNNLAYQGAAYGGHLDLLKELRTRGYPWGETCNNAQRNGHKEILEWARREGCPWEQLSAGLKYRERYITSSYERNRDVFTRYNENLGK